MYEGAEHVQHNDVFFMNFFVLLIFFFFWFYPRGVEPITWQYVIHTMVFFIGLVGAFMLNDQRNDNVGVFA